MKKHFVSFIAICIFVSTITFSVSAEDNFPDLSKMNFQSASVNVSTTNNGTYKITLNNIEQSTNSYRTTTTGQEEQTSTSIAFIAETETEREEILDRIAQIRSGGGNIYNEDWFFGNSCYIYISITYASKTTSYGTVCRINSITTRYSVNSGTYVSNAIITMQCIGTSEDQESTYLHDIEQVTSSPYTSTTMSSWPYIYNGGPLLGVSFEVTARRSSGSSETNIITANVFQN